MTIRLKEETRWCVHCTKERTVTWLTSDDKACTQRTRNCPVCGVLLMYLLSGTTQPLDPLHLVVWDEQKYEKINAERNTEATADA